MHVYLLISFLLILGGCSHMDPHFWPERFKVPRQSASSGGDGQAFRSLARPSVLAEPSPARTEWKTLPKQHDSQRDYLLTIRDREGKLIPTDFPPEIIVDGEANLVEVAPVGPAAWRVRVDFPRDQAIIQVGFTLGEWRVERLRRLHWQLHRLDVMQSSVHANKARIRADGEDELRVYFLLRDSQEFPIYQHQDFNLRLRSTGPAKIYGPHDSVTGAYFRVVTSVPGKLAFEAFVDGEPVGRPVEVEAQAQQRRVPASVASDDCLRSLAEAVNGKWDPKATPEDEYLRLSDQLIADFERVVMPTELQMERTIERFSSPACTTVKAFDLHREYAGSRVRRLTWRSFRQSTHKGLNSGLFNQRAP